LEERRQQYIKSVRYMYRNHNVQHQMMFVLSAQNFNQVYRRMRFMDEYTTLQKAQGEAVKQKSEQVAQKRNELNEANTRLNTLLAASETQQEQLKTRQAEQERLVNKLKQEQQTVKKLITQQQQEEAELNRQIERLIAEEKERARKAEEERMRQLAAAEQQRRTQQAKGQGNAQTGGQGNGQTGTGTKTNDKKSSRRSSDGKSTSNKTTASASASTYSSADPDRKLSGSFANNKGRLPVPITGNYRVVRNFGAYSLAGVTLESKGLHLEGQNGAQARCVFDGEVSTIYNLGNSYFVMVRHGRYISVYGNLASVNVKKGQHVNTNQSLGAVGNGNVLIFRLQNWDKLLNPKSWLSRL
ncbi:MAG: murein hydrolase activator EnvC family protein, partial [Prevotella sp.]